MSEGLSWEYEILKHYHRHGMFGRRGLVSVFLNEINENIEKEKRLTQLQNFGLNDNEVTSIFQELRIILPKLVEKKAISIFEDGERNIINNSSITLDEKTELIFELRKLRDDAIIVQKMYAVQYVDTLDSIYKNVKERQESLEYQKQLNELLEQEEKKRITEIEKEKESIRQEILSKKRPQVPEWIKDNAKQWSEGLIEDRDFTDGI